MQRMARDFLLRKGVEEARLEADLLVAHALATNRLGLLLRLDQPVQPAEIDRARDLLVRRGRREPVAYITGVREFYGRPFRVGPGALIPRPETELIVDLARERMQGRAAPRVLDIGTGSGCLAVTLALELTGAEVVAAERSPAALEWARENVAALAARVELCQGDGLAVARERAPFDLVVCNPPYVDPRVAAELEPEVRDYEPPEALFAPEGDPDHWLRALLAAAPTLLAPGGVLLVELGHDQAPRRASLARGAEARLHADLAGVERVLEWSQAASPGDRR
jgi:release factor glutamine methyltransferase